MDTLGHFREPMTVEATLETAAKGLWDVEIRALDPLLASPGPRHGMVDLGCGTGRIAANIGGAFKKVTLVDFSPEMLELASRAVRSRNPDTDVETLCVDVAAVLTPAPDVDVGPNALGRRTRDSSLVTIGNCLCYVTGRANRIRVLETLATTLRNNAGVLISNHVVPSLGMALEALEVDSAKLRRAAADPLFADGLLDTQSDDGSPVHWFTKDLLESEITAAGLTIHRSEASSDKLRAAFLCSRSPRTMR